VINRNESFIQPLIFSIMKTARKATKAARKATKAATKATKAARKATKAATKVAPVKKVKAVKPKAAKKKVKK
jgi:histone H1/5